MRPQAALLLAAMVLGASACSDLISSHETDIKRIVDEVGKQTKAKGAKCSSKDGAVSCACHVKCIRTETDCHCDDGGNY